MAHVYAVWMDFTSALAYLLHRNEDMYGRSTGCLNNNFILGPKPPKN